MKILLLKRIKEKIFKESQHQPMATFIAERKMYLPHLTLHTSALKL